MGDDIPYLARILHVADAFDLVVNRRSGPVAGED